MFCKPMESFDYVGKVGEQRYLFHTFYGSKETKFYTKIEDHYIKIKGKAGIMNITRSIRFYVEPDTNCVIVNYSNPQCPTPEPIKCCPMQTAEEQAIEAREAFWKRPIPEILREEIQKDNGTLPQDNSEESLIKPYDPIQLAPEQP